METIHQLTHHVKILQASASAAAASSSSSSSASHPSTSTILPKGMNLSMLRSPEHTGLQHQSLTMPTMTSTGAVTFDLPSTRKSLPPATPVLQQSYSSGRKGLATTSSTTPGSSLHYPNMRSRVGIGSVDTEPVRERVVGGGVGDLTEVELEVPPPPWEKRSLLFSSSLTNPPTSASTPLLPRQVSSATKHPNSG